MIVDVHTRIWESTEQLGRVAEQLRRRRSEPWQRPTASAPDHARAMRPVAAAFIHGFESSLLQASISHEKIAEYVRHDPARYRGFAGIDPTQPRPLQSLERARALNLVGVTLSPAAQGFHPADSRAMQLYEACEQYGMPIYFESGISLAREAVMAYAQPQLLDEVLRSFPQLKLIIASIGHPWIEQTLALLAKHPTAYADLAELILQPWQLYNALLAAHQQRVMNQVCFASSFPFAEPEQAIVTVYSVNTLVQGTHMPSVPREQLRSIVERDMLACLDLPSVDQATPRPDDSATHRVQSLAEMTDEQIAMLPGSPLSEHA